MTSPVKKSSTLLKRVVRLGQYWLYDYKDRKQFASKVKNLIVDYLRRTLLGQGKK
jgi:hypothetical protein